jgi:hypothetical protein
MTVDFDGTNLQEEYLSKWVKLFGEEGHVGTPDKVAVDLRFVYRDASHNKHDSSSPVKYDEVKIEILSSKEDPTVYCDELTNLTIETGTEVTGVTFDYAITSGESVEFDFGAVIDEAKYDKLKEICRDTLWYTLDFQNSEGKWNTQFSTKWEATDMENREIMATIKEGKIEVGITQDQFMNDVQTMRQAMD